ncbi:SDR family NAD(P)-dependent oxidoreductase, partial [Cardiobacterium hominis]
TLAQELALNLEAPIALAAGLLPLLAQHPRGAIINITTALALAPKKSAPVYCASKAGLRNFTRALRYQTEAAAPHIQVQEIIPPLVATRMTAGRGTGKMTPEAVATAIIRVIERGDSEHYIGKTRLLKWLLRLAPGVAYRILKDG